MTNTNLDNLLLQEIRPQNIFSFGPKTKSFSMKNLNVFIGCNGSGKSNFIKVLRLIKLALETPEKLDRPQDWLWKGTSAIPDYDRSPRIDFLGYHPPINQRFRYSIQLDPFDPFDPCFSNQPFNFFLVKNATSLETELLTLPMGMSPDASLLISHQSLDQEMADSARTSFDIQIYDKWFFGQNHPLRRLQKKSLYANRLAEDFSNSAAFLNQICQDPTTKAKLLTHLRDLNSELTDFELCLKNDTVWISFKEGECEVLPGQVSDATLNYMCLLAILCDPNPPPLICIEHPELGLHSDILGGLTRLLIETSSRTQLIVTTHSEIIVDALTEYPEFVVVCEKYNRQTEMVRLNKENLSDWLADYRLGQLWTMGQLGGNRW